MPAGEGSLAGGAFKDEIDTVNGWYVPNFDEGAEDGETPHTISQWYSADREGV